MLHKLAKIGQIVPASMFPKNELGLNFDYKVEEILFINFKKTDTQWQFSDIQREEYASSKADKYLMKTAKGRATSEFPAVDVYKSKDLLNDDGEISFTESKIGKKLVFILRKHETLFKDIIEALETSTEISEQLSESVGEIGRFALSIKLDNEYLGDTTYMKDILEEYKADAGNPDYYTYKNKVYKGRDKICSITCKPSSEVWGYASPYKFYAVKTELGSVPGGFDAKQAWKNFPVSPEAADWLDKGSQFMQEYLRFRFCGYNYFLLPERVLSRGDDSSYLEYLQDFKKFNIGEDGKENKNLEEDLLELIKTDEDNAISYSLFFYEENNSEFKILASVDDVFPSYASAILKAKEAAEDHDIFKGYKLRKDEIGDLKFTFRNLKEFIPEQGAFLEVVRSIFMQKKVDFSFLMHKIMHKIQVAHARDELYPTTILRAFIILKVLNRLNIITQPQQSNPIIMENKYEAFFEEHNDFFNTPGKKAVFLTGVLAQFLLDIQYQERSATPFRSRLNSLKLNEKILKRLLPEIIAKLEQYGKNYYKSLETSISEYLVSSNLSDLKDDEISFYFTLGMNLNKRFKPDKTESKQGQEELF
jgi:CRISPR-associated protein Csh1